MTDITDNFVEDFGLEELPENELDNAKDFLSSILEERIGDVLMQKLNDDQLNAFEELVKFDRPEALSSWLKEQVPESEQIAQEELGKLKQQVRSDGLASLGSIEP